MRKLLLTISVALAACSHAKHEKIDLGGAKAQQAITVASNYAVSHFGAPSCRDTNTNWKYSLRQDGGSLIADIGPKAGSTSRIHIVMKASDLKILKAYEA